MTITLDEETARWARIEAAKQGVSLSRFVGRLLNERMTKDERYQEAMRAFFDRPLRALKAPGEKYPTRESLYDSGRLR